MIDENVIEDLAEQHLGLTYDEMLASSADFQSQDFSNFTQFFDITSPRGAFSMRVMEPKDPVYKTLSELATLDHIRAATSIPVPRVIASDSSSDNELGFEYILTEGSPGQSLRAIWPTLTWEQKVALVKQVAEVTAQMHALRYEQMGSLFALKDLTKQNDQSRESSYAQEDRIIGRLVSRDFLTESSLPDVPRGPFRSDREWLNVRLDLAKDDNKQDLDFIRKNPSSDPDNDDYEEAMKTQAMITRLRNHLDTFFRPESDNDVFYLFNDNLSDRKIMVSPEGELQAVVDWSCVSTRPSWKVHQYPRFLVTSPASVDGSDEVGPVEYEVNDDGGLYKLFPDQREFKFWHDQGEREFLHDQRERECTHLRRVFAEKMDSLIPGWSAEAHRTQPQRDFDMAIDCCFSTGRGSNWSMVKAWLDCFEKRGTYLDFHTACDLIATMERSNNLRRSRETTNGIDDEDEPSERADVYT
ncbi:hypothetical protein MBLNU457_g0876t1 [Dothideomycetes sp. NU457]